MPQYRRRIRAWVAYDVANSAFATTVLAAVLPTYYSSVAGATLPTPATATAYYTLTLSLSVGVAALIAPPLAAIADALGVRLRMLLGFAGVGILATAPLYLVGEGDWLLASLLFGVAQIGFANANVLYDALLPHVAAPADQDRVSARGYAAGYLGGGVLLAANVALIFTLDARSLGVRLSFLSVAAWWLLFALPLARRVPEPAATLPGVKAAAVARASLTQVLATLRSLRSLPDLRRYLVAFLVYNDGINVVITTAAIYGAELGFATSELILAILLVQFLGIGYSLAFGALPGPGGGSRMQARVDASGLATSSPRQRYLLAFVCWNLVALPAVGIAARLLLPADLVGGAPAFESALPVILGLLVAVQVVGAAAAVPGSRLLAPFADRLDTRGGIVLALCAYLIVAVWGFALNSVVEFWALAWLVAVVQGGSQALSRSLYARLVPERRSSEFFAFFSVLSRFTSFLSPLLFAASVALFATSRPAVLTLSLLFGFGIVALRRVDVGRGMAAAAQADARAPRVAAGA